MVEHTLGGIPIAGRRLCRAGAGGGAGRCRRRNRAAAFPGLGRASAAASAVRRARPPCRNGLRGLRQAGAGPHDWVLVHDAARCLVTPSQIEALIAACRARRRRRSAGASVADTLKVGAPDGRVASTPTRADKWLAQTPQMFRIGMLLDALERSGDAVTDEAGAIEAVGLAPLLVPGSAQNFKLTYAEDFELAEAVLRSRRSAS